MPYQFDVVAWEDWEGNVHGGQPDDISQVAGMQTHVYDQETGDTNHYPWTYIDPPPFDDWDSWYYLIDDVLYDHGYATA
jgi:hypothetical protein